MEKSTIIEIKSKLLDILRREHSNYRKQEISETPSAFRFACPVCGDSETKVTKKRGNVFFNSGMFHCYNCGDHRSVLKLLEKFNEPIDNMDIRIEIRKLVQDQNVKFLSSKVDEISQEKIDKLSEFAIDKQKIIDKMGLLPIYKSHPYIKKKLLHNKLDHMAYKNGNVIFFNMIDETKVIGFQTRTINPGMVKNGMKYIKYPITKIYEKFFPDETPTDPVFKNLDKISLLYGFLSLDFNRKITVFEGASDSWLYPNSIGKSSVGVGDAFLDELDTRYFFDNDRDGYTKMAEKLKQGKEVFMWKKFLDDHYLDYDAVKDWADIISLSAQTGTHYFKETEKYFTDDPLDLIYVQC